MAKPKNTSPDGDAASMDQGVSFEDSFRKLSEMAEQLEAGGLTLADATARFEEGMKLVQHCNELLNNAELKITELKESYRVESAQSGMNGFDEPDEDSEEDPED